MKDRSWFIRAVPNKSARYQVQWAVDYWAERRTGNSLRAFGPTKFSALRAAARTRQERIAWKMMQILKG